MKIEDIREDFDVFNKYVYLNTAAFSPIPRQTIKKISEYLSLRRYGTVEIDEEEILGEARNLVAMLLNASEEEVAFTLNTGHGLNIVANGLEYGDGDNVVVADCDFPSVVYPFLNKGVDVRFVKCRNWSLRIDDLERLVDDHTRIIAVSHVQFTSGYRIDVKDLVEIAHEHDALVVVDVAQSLGAVKVDVKDWDVDVIVGIGYKWLMSPTGIGFLYVKRERIDEIKPSLPGWASVKNRDEFSTTTLNLFDNARRYETGNLCLSCVVGLAESIKYLCKLDLAWVENRVLELSHYAIERLGECEESEIYTPLDKRYRAGIVFFRLKNTSSSKIVDDLRNKNIIVSGRKGCIRVSTHFYNSRQDVDRMVSYLEELT
ncbi:MAG: cysteine desulfurase [Thermofilum sp. ex4484_79]|nr:MAG: cysteine desulfurase [Thermofilum sp. ex4484_79]